MDPRPEIFRGRDAHAYHRLAWVHDPVLLDAVRTAVARAAPHRPVVLLDIGTGTGAVLAALHDLGTTRIGVDLHWDMLRLARSFVRERTGTVPTLIRADAHHLPFADGTIDVAIMRNVLHYLTDARQALAEIRRILARDGAFVIAESVSPTERTLEWWKQTLLAKNPYRREDLFFTPTRLADYLQQSGLAVDDVQVVRQHSEIENWLRRPGIPAPERQRLVARFAEAPADVRADHRVESRPGGSLLVQRTSAVITSRPATAAA
jgi:ubiquinone/menaquinone biosynthesis C-methylase UbiE